jgi:uncharacterized protein YndB with AHSA1/START domain
VDARVGGGYRVTFGPEPEGDLHVEAGHYTIVDPITRLRWDSRLTGDRASEASRIDLTFNPDGEDTILGIVESGLSEASVADHELGWTGALDRLELLAGRRSRRAVPSASDIVLAIRQSYSDLPMPLYLKV